MAPLWEWQSGNEESPWSLRDVADGTCVFDHRPLLYFFRHHIEPGYFLVLERKRGRETAEVMRTDAFKGQVLCYARHLFCCTYGEVMSVHSGLMSLLPLCH